LRGAWRVMGGGRGLRVRADWRGAVRIVERVMGEYHAYYAAWAARAGGGLVARVGGRPAGAVVYYQAGLPGATLGVVYYVAVLPEFRGLGLGRVLVASAEEAMVGSHAYVATTTDSNAASKRLFRSMGYTVESWEGLEARLGPVAAEALRLATCAYEDDIVMVREEEPGALHRLAPESLGAAQGYWEKLCLRPWLERRRGPKSALGRVLGALEAPLGWVGLTF